MFRDVTEEGPNSKSSWWFSSHKLNTRAFTGKVSRNQWDDDRTSPGTTYSSPTLLSVKRMVGAIVFLLIVMLVVKFLIVVGSRTGGTYPGSCYHSRRLVSTRVE